jgi:hypothetical protein
MDFNKVAHPLPVVARALEELLLFVEVGSSAKGAFTFSCENEGGNFMARPAFFS